MYWKRMIKTSDELTDPPFCYGFVIKTESLQTFQQNGNWFLRIEDDEWYQIFNEKIHGHIWMKPIDAVEREEEEEEDKEEFPFDFKDMLIWIDPLFHLIKMYPEACY